ncbi:MAG TPA: sensor histidine kinase [Rhodocyclaceae bacterium]|jgi:two-component system sensor histidine kinase UhpB|nr:sensor histidine kinase [Rhodocyclaceae bacterium]HNB78688.1 sensor histidine kinase [Rhodocyclaceae bacterium]HNH13767.1 sensor histidine kinase [Rhodocyclaceae bacterium]HNH98684.1 sensor histidine kinase [Rhodocyclaceae bacterium]
MDRNPCELQVTMVANAEHTEAPAVLARELRVPAAGSPIRSRGSGGLRANPIHARIKRDVATVVLITIGTFLLSSTFEVYENWFGWTRDFESMQIDELPLTFLVMAMAIGWFAWRRAQEFGSELRLRMLAEVKLVDSEEQYRRLSRRYLEAQESERRHLARELHDELGQYLNAIKVDAVALRDYTKSSGGDARRSAATIVDLTDHVYGVVRTLMSQLRPVALDELGLIPALQHCIEGWRMRLPQLGFDLFANEGELGMLDEQVRLTAFRIVQESLTNAARHARATRVSVMLGREAGTIRAVVQDDGIGMDAKTRTNGLGLVGMRDRVEALGGTLSIRSSPQFGTRIEARIPLVVRDDVARPEAIDDRGPAG